MFMNDRNGRAGSDRASLYDDITSKIIAELEAGRFPWVQPWGSASVKAPLAIPRNAATGRHYSGINVLILWGGVIQRGFPGQSWLTFRQALSLGGNVRRGEHGTTVVYADRFTPEEREAPRPRDWQGSRRDPVPQALHGVQHGAMRRAAGRCRYCGSTASARPEEEFMTIDTAERGSLDERGDDGPMCRAAVALADSWPCCERPAWPLDPGNADGWAELPIGAVTGPHIGVQ